VLAPAIQTANGHVRASELAVSSQRAPRAGVRASKRLFRRCLRHPRQSCSVSHLDKQIPEQAIEAPAFFEAGRAIAVISDWAPLFFCYVRHVITGPRIVPGSGLDPRRVPVSLL
jgi:hypothetical protein